MDIPLQPLLVFLFVLARLGGVLALVPLPGRSLPPRMRILLGIVAAAILTPLHLDAPSPVSLRPVSLRPDSLHRDTWQLDAPRRDSPRQDAPDSAPVPRDTSAAVPGPSVFLIAMGREITLGLAHGLALLILVAGLQLAGQLISQLSGLQLADVFDPELGTSVPVVARLLELVAVAVFLVLGGHRQVLSAVLDSFRWMPPGRAEVPRDLVLALADVAGHSFELGLRIASPVLAALLISTLTLGLISRTLPQLNVLALGFGLNTLVMLAALFLSLGTVVLVFQQYVVLAVEQVQQAVAGLSPGG